MKKTLFLLACSVALCASPIAFAATTDGTINATLTLTTGCLVNGQPATNGVNFGTLDFGSSAATFDTLTSALQGSAGAGIYVLCTTGQTYSVQLTGSNPAPATVFGTAGAQPRYLLLGGDPATGITYTLFSDNTYATPIANNTDLPANGTASPTLGDNYLIYGQVVGGGFNATIPAGTYTDTISVAVNY